MWNRGGPDRARLEVSESERCEHAAKFHWNLFDLRDQIGLGNENLFSPIVGEYSLEHQFTRRERVLRNFGDGWCHPSDQPLNQNGRVVMLAQRLAIDPSIDQLYSSLANCRRLFESKLHQLDQLGRIFGIGLEWFDIALGFFALKEKPGAVAKNVEIKPGVISW